MTEQTSPRSAPMLPSNDLAALLEVHRRLLGATLRCNGILAEAVRAWAERQATIARAAWGGLGVGGPAMARALTAGEPLFSGERVASLVDEVGAELAAMQRTLMDAQLLMLQELARAFLVESPASTAPTPDEMSTAGQVERAAAPAEAVRAEADAVPAPVETAAGDVAKPRRGRRAAVAG